MDTDTTQYSGGIYKHPNTSPAYHHHIDLDGKPYGHEHRHAIEHKNTVRKSYGVDPYSDEHNHS